jgi:hypothetical protein
VSDEGQKAYFEGKIAEHCKEMRVLALRISDMSLQEEALKTARTSLVQAYATQQVELQKLVGLAKKMLGLEGEWICTIDSGQLSQSPQPEEDQSQEE